MKTQCPNCKAKFNVDDKFAGKQAKCPKCTKPFTIEPFIETPAVTTPPAASPKPVEKPAVAPAPAPRPEPVAPPPKAAPPADPPTPAATPAIIPQPVKKINENFTAEHAKPLAESRLSEAETTEKKNKVISAWSPRPSAVSAVRPESQPISKPLRKSGLSKVVFVYAWIVVRLIAGGLAGWGLMLALKRGERSTLIAVFAAADVFLICSVLIELMLFYKMWAAIADNQTSVTPAKAVGFLFIPVFNLYWALNMIMAFAEDYNAFIERRSLKANDLPITLFMLYAFAFMLTMIFITVPMLCAFAFVTRISGAFASYTQVAWLLVGFAVLAGVGHFFTYIFFATKTCDAVNALPD